MSHIDGTSSVCPDCECWECVCLVGEIWANNLRSIANDTSEEVQS